MDFGDRLINILLSNYNTLSVLISVFNLYHRSNLKRKFLSGMFKYFNDKNSYDADNWINILQWQMKYYDSDNWIENFLSNNTHSVFISALIFIIEAVYNTNSKVVCLKYFNDNWITTVLVIE